MTTDFEQQLSRSLERRASGADLTPQRLTDVRDRAGRISRRRTAVVAAGVVAALVVSVPIGLSLGGDPDSGTDDTPIATQGPEGPKNVVFDAEAPRGEPPAIAWASGLTLHQPGSPSQGLDTSYTSITRVGSRLLALDTVTGPGQVIDLTNAGQVLSHATVLIGPLADPAQEVAAWVEQGRGIVWLDEQGERVIHADASVQLQAVDADGVWFTPDGAGGPLRHLGQDGTLGEPIDAMEVKGSHGDLTSVLLSLDEKEATSCGGVLRASDDLVWRTCDYTVESFSPDGEWVAATDPYLDGLGQNTVAILAADTGEVQAHFEIEDGVIVDRRWEDSDHVLVLTRATNAHTWQVMRMGRDGSVEQAVAPEVGPDYGPPFTLAH